MTTREQMKIVEEELRRQERLLASLFEKDREEKRILSSDDRDHVINYFASDLHNSVDTGDAVDAMIEGTRFNKGYEEMADDELLREVFDGYGRDHASQITDRPLWRNHLSNNLAAVGVLGDWLNE